MLKKIKKTFSLLIDPMPLNDFSDYDEYWEQRVFDKPSLDRTKVISRYIKPNARILDVGCGEGTTIEYLSQHNTPAYICGIDVSKKAVEFVRKKGFIAEQIDILSDDFKKYLIENKFDYIILAEVIEHVQDPEKVINSCKGNFSQRIFVTIPNAGFFVHRLRLLFGKFPVVVIVEHVKEHIRFWTLKDFLFWAHNYGYTVEKYISYAGLNFKPLYFLERMFPSLFSYQIIYILKEND